MKIDTDGRIIIPNLNPINKPFIYAGIIYLALFGLALFAPFVLYILFFPISYYFANLIEKKIKINFKNEG